MFSFDVARPGSGPVIAAHGEVDASTARQLAAALESEITSAPGSTVTVDLSDVSFLDSTGLGALVSAKKAASATGGDVALRGVPTRIMRILEITSLTQVFTIG